MSNNENKTQTKLFLKGFLKKKLNLNRVHYQNWCTGL
jgi:hypothetical protein